MVRSAAGGGKDRGHCCIPGEQHPSPELMGKPKGDMDMLGSPKKGHEDAEGTGAAEGKSWDCSGWRRLRRVFPVCVNTWREGAERTQPQVG